MTIWILAILLLASLAALGYRQGGIRVGISLIGIIFAALLALPLARVFKPILGAVGVSNPVLLWALAPFLGFVLVNALFKIGAMFAHQKVEVYYKYHAGDLRIALWERLNQRMGLCLGLANGTAYLILLSFVIYAFSYWTVQMATTDSEPMSVRVLNRMGKDLESTGMSKVARAVDRLAPAYYETADIVGLVYHNPLLEARLTRYPAFLALAERQEFQDLANDHDFHERRLRREPISELMNHPKAQVVLQNPDTLRELWQTAVPNLKDLHVFLETGKSPKYDQERILGRWNFDVNSALMLVRKARPNLPSPEMQKLRNRMSAMFANTSFVAATENQAILKNVPPLTPSAAPTELQTLHGKWKGFGANYELTFETGGATQQFDAVVEGDRLTINTEGMGLAFLRED